MSELSDYCIGKRLSNDGAFSVVHIAKHFETREYSVVKIMDIRDLKEAHMYKQIKLEIDIQTRLNHKNIVKVVDKFQDDNYIYLFLEYMMKGDLFDLVYNLYDEPCDEDEAKRYIYDIAKGIQCLHENGIIHRDVKMENCLVDEYDRVKISDFGWSVDKKVNYKRDEMRPNRGMELKMISGTKECMAPECMRGDDYDEKIDIWGLGIIMYELLTLDMPFKKMLINNDNLFKKVVAKSKIKYPKHISEEAKDLMQRMFENDPRKRASIDEILQHPWLKDMEEVWDMNNSEDEDTFTFDENEEDDKRRYSV